MPVVPSVPSRPSIASGRRAAIAGPNSCRAARWCCLRPARRRPTRGGAKRISRWFGSTPANASTWCHAAPTRNTPAADCSTSRATGSWRRRSIRDGPKPRRGATTVLDDVAPGGGGGALLTISSSGSLAYATAAPATPQPLIWVDRTGREQALSMAAGVYTTPRLSPDGHRVAVAVSSANTDVWVYDLDRGTSTRLTFEGGNLSPAWTPDGARVAFASNRHGPSEIYWTTADGGGGAEQLTTSDTIHLATSWSPDGRTLLLMSVNAALNTDVLMWSQGGGLQPFLQTAFAEERAVFSPDGRWVAYVLNEANRGEVFVRAFSDGDRRWQISNAGGTDPVWSRNGRELFYRQGDDMMAVDVASGASFSAGTPRRLFSGRYAGGVVASYDVSADGHFLMVRAPAAAETREIRIAVGWVDDARRQVADANR